MKNTDVKLNNDKGYHDISIGDDGDFEKTNSFDTAILLSIFCERRASVTEVAQSFRRRGWIGNIGRPVEYGSKLWLIYQARLINRTVNKARDYLEQSLEWLIDFGYIKAIQVNTIRDIENSSLLAEVKLIRFDDSVESRTYVLWDNTGRG